MITLNTPPKQPHAFVLRVVNIQRSFQAFVQSSTFSGVLLILCTGLALAWANSPWSAVYYRLLDTPITIQIGNIDERFSLLSFINDGVMVLFFFVVGAEIKRELIIGELSNKRTALLPIVAAVFGMAVPGLLFYLFNTNLPTERGWAIPSATDIAFSLGVLTLLGSRVPMSAKIFLAALAIVDDLGAVVVIALFYSQQITVLYLGLTVPILLALAYCNRRDVQSPLPYTLLGILLWYCIHHSGIHATVAGVILAMMVPISAPLRREDFIQEVQTIMGNIEECALQDQSFEQDIVHALESSCNRVQPPLIQFLHTLEPYNAYLIIPLFALANAGVVLQGNVLAGLQQPVSLGILAGLFLGKPLGIMFAVWIMHRLMGTALPDRMTWSGMLGVAWLCGIGFTMSLFVGGLSFTDMATLSTVKIAILWASLLSGIAGYVVLRVALRGVK